MVNTGQRVVKPVWDNAKRVNHQKNSNKLKYPQARRTFVPSGVLTMTGLVNPVRTNGKRAIHTVSTARPISTARHDHVVVDSGCSSHMTGNKAYLSDFEDYNEGFVAFGSDLKGDELNFKLLDENQVMLRAPRQNGVYNLDLKNIVPSGGTQEHYVVSSLEKDKEPTEEYILLPLHPHRPRISVEDKKNLLKLLLRTPMYSIQKMLLKRKNNIYDATRQAFEEEKKRATVLTNLILVGHLLVLPIHHCGAHDDEDVGAEADFNNMDNTIDVSPIPTLRVHKDHPKGQILGDPKSAVQTGRKIQKASSVQ
ncbi:hypothetical protein Tco_1081726 [Tanacetum coccineum]|uniref:Retrovirus-related Pol polyprotein from transposon TNT 1-94-like beta-barrel domain-containing protein n=1 Tax=Tanacetum coccineum TaxID=301880 RepID=A0ABQ5HY93_9ASTR